MNKKLIITIIPLMILCSCKSNSSSRTPSVPTVTWTDTGTSDDTSSSNTDVITGSVSVTEPDKTGAHEITFNEARELAKTMSEYQDSEEFSLPSELTMSVSTTGSTDIAISGIESLNSYKQCVYSESNAYYRVDTSGNNSLKKTWKYIGESPVEGETGNYYLEAEAAGDSGTYTKEKIETEEDRLSKTSTIKETYAKDQTELLTGKTVLGQLDIGESDGTAKFECKFYSKGAGSLIVYGTITVNNYELTIGETTYSASVKSAVAYTWDNYIITSGSTNSKFKTKVLIDINGELTTTQITTLKANDLTKPNYSNFVEENLD